MKLCNAKDILAIAHLVNRTPQSYDWFIMCSPFISEDLLLSKIICPGSVRVPTTIITSQESSAHLINAIKRCPNLIKVISVPNLHAKVYFARGKDKRDSSVILGSFNATRAALDKNYELGVRITGETLSEISLICDVENALARIINTNEN